MEATKATLIKDYVKGIQFEGPFVQDHCIPCLVSKSPQRSYSYQGNRAGKVAELLHMDLCGPFPVQAGRSIFSIFSMTNRTGDLHMVFGSKVMLFCTT